MQPKIRSILPLALLLSSPLLIGGTGERADFNARLLAAHNAERARIGVPALAWDPAGSELLNHLPEASLATGVQ